MGDYVTGPSGESPRPGSSGIGEGARRSEDLFTRAAAPCRGVANVAAYGRMPLTAVPH